MLTTDVRREVEASNTQYGKFGSNYKQQETFQSDNMTVDNVYNELILLRKNNRALGERIKHLEVQNFNITTQTGFNVGQNNEPNRPMMLNEQARNTSMKMME